MPSSCTSLIYSPLSGLLAAVAEVEASLRGGGHPSPSQTLGGNPRRITVTLDPRRPDRSCLASSPPSPFVLSYTSLLYFASSVVLLASPVTCCRSLCSFVHLFVADDECARSAIHVSLLSLPPLPSSVLFLRARMVAAVRLRVDAFSLLPPPPHLCCHVTVSRKLLLHGLLGNAFTGWILKA